MRNALRGPSESDLCRDMPREMLAAIDVGTNTVLLLVITRAARGAPTVLADEARITRLGEGVGAHGVFCEAAMTRTLAVLRDYAALCRRHGCARILAVGTAAFRRVTNGAAFCARVERECGIRIEVIPGEREARLSHAAAARDFGDDVLVCDIGGGSTEYIWKDGDRIAAVSLPIGSVLLHEQYGHSDPIAPEDYARMQGAIAAALHAGLAPPTRDSAPPWRRPARLVALAGTATTLAAMQLRLRAYHHAQVHGHGLALADVQGLRDALRTRTIAERRKLPGLEPARADVILPGAILLVETMQLLGYERVTISDRGVRWGLVYEVFEQT